MSGGLRLDPVQGEAETKARYRGKGARAETLCRGRGAKGTCMENEKQTQLKTLTLPSHFLKFLQDVLVNGSYWVSLFKRNYYH